MATPQLDRAPPSATAYVIATAILAGVTGYFIGQGASVGIFGSGSKSSRTKQRKSWPNSYDVKVPVDSSEEGEYDDESEEEEDESEEGEIADFSANTDDVKLVLVVRTDLGMTKGTPPSLSQTSLHDRRSSNTSRRKNSSPMLARHPLRLQNPQHARALARPTPPVGTSRPSQDRAAGALGGRDGGVASAGDESGALRARGAGCGPDADC